MPLVDLNVSPFFAEVTPSNTTSYSQGIARALYVGNSGNVVVVDANGNAVTFTNVQNGQILPVAHQRVNATGTTATNMVALF